MKQFNRTFLTLSCCMVLTAHAAGDPFNTLATVAPTVTGYLVQTCSVATGPMTLVDVVDTALCNNPQTRAAWANTRVAAAQLGSAQSAYLPTINGNASLSRDHIALTGATATNKNLGLSLNYLLFDFGTRSAQTDAARATLEAANRTQDQTVNAVYLAVVQAYYQYFAAQAQLEALREAEKSAQLSLDAANARYQAGANTKADVLQAQTAYSQARLSSLRGEGSLRIAQGVLTNAMGLVADQPLSLAPPADQVPASSLPDNVRDLILQAQQQRPDLQAAAAQLRAAQAQVRAASAAGKPTVSLTASSNYQDNGSLNGAGSSVGVAVAVPLFSGFNTTYKVRAAEAQVTASQAQQAQLANQVALDVWRAWQTLATETAALTATDDLIRSATASAQLALGRYRAGVGNILDVLSAQASLANARSQQVQAQYNWRIAKVTLVQAVGRLE
ncbi:TolC family protein [Sulfuriferula thiophila]|uniref:TolC family protein n=1 Tax=Sulfuriferula thiophila TaxID=1781211 RepID=UPI000F6159BC|nr:TolC family protein [Sulfuriferula thiophila]